MVLSVGPAGDAFEWNVVLGADCDAASAAGQPGSTVSEGAARLELASLWPFPSSGDPAYARPWCCKWRLRSVGLRRWRSFSVTTGDGSRWSSSGWIAECRATAV